MKASKATTIDPIEISKENFLQIVPKIFSAEQSRIRNTTIKANTFYCDGEGNAYKFTYAVKQHNRGSSYDILDSSSGRTLHRIINNHRRAPHRQRNHHNRRQQQTRRISLKDPQQGLRSTPLLLQLLDRPQYEGKLRKTRERIRRYRNDTQGYTFTDSVIELPLPAEIPGRLIAVLSPEILGKGAYGKVKRTLYAIHQPPNGEPKLWSTSICVKIVENSPEYWIPEEEFAKQAVNEAKVTEFYLRTVKRSQLTFSTFFRQHRFRQHRTQATKSYLPQPEAADVLPLDKFCQQCNPSPAILLRAIAEISHQLHILHRKYVHSDLKPENILINSHTMEITMVDFGLAVEVDFGYAKGTPYYQAFELLHPRPQLLGEKIDVFSVTMTLFDLCKRCYSDNTHSLLDPKFQWLQSAHSKLATDRDKSADSRQYSVTQRITLIETAKVILDEQIVKIFGNAATNRHITPGEAVQLEAICKKGTALNPCERSTIQELYTETAELQQAIQAREEEATATRESGSKSCTAPIFSTV